jgi:glycosyltransferase involved in cell wall biosynthesis
MVTGTVEDVRPFVREAAVYVVPLRAGGGTRLKIFEALALEKAVVSTTVGAEGLALTPGREAVIADDPSDFAGEVVALLRDADRRRALGAAGRRLVESRYSWATVAGQFESLCEEAVAGHAESTDRTVSRADLPRERSPRLRGARVVASQQYDSGRSHHRS